MDKFFEIESTEKYSNLFLKLYFCMGDQKICIVDNISDIKSLNSVIEQIKNSLEKVLSKGEKFF
ncbi:hypothetical protein, partial [Desulfothermus sp.]